MPTSLPTMHQFRTETTQDGILHLIFDAPGRSMNVFSNAAMKEVEAFANWLPQSDVLGVVVRSAKPSAFCAGADLGELSTAYDLIMGVPSAERKAAALKRFAPIGRAFRKLETGGKPVAAAISGLALGGGCELALGCHYRVMADTPQTALGLPESLVGLLPAAGGTQRMPRLIGIEASLPILLDGARLSPQAAVAAGAAHEIAVAGTEVTAAERWIRASPRPLQPWDRPDWKRPDGQATAASVRWARENVLRDTRGHYPALLAILDCVERGLREDIDLGIATEIGIFADLIQRPEARNMIQVLFLGRVDYEKRKKGGTLPAQIEAIKQDVAVALAAGAVKVARSEIDAAARQAGFTKPLESHNNAQAEMPVLRAGVTGGFESAGLWFERPKTEAERIGAGLLGAAALAASGHAVDLSEDEQRVVDYAIVKDLGFPGYLGGPFALWRYLGPDRLRALIGR
jgi:3-hydroxyacyl-CoA dehydrogenase / enoyl-CoA hydratase / 3-hydroxybutyryl-CoA epimerase